MIVAMLNVQYVMCNIHVATCLPRLDATCRTDEEVGMFGRIVLLHRDCGRRCQDMLVSVYQWISNLLCCPAVCGSSCLFLQVPGLGLCTGWIEVVCEHPP